MLYVGQQFTGDRNGKKEKKVHFTWGDVSEPIIQLKP